MLAFEIPLGFDEAVERTRDCQDWTLLTVDQRLVRDVFVSAIVKGPVSVFETYADHPFWSRWRSKGSEFQNGVLDMALNSSRDWGWVFAFVSANVMANPAAFPALALNGLRQMPLSNVSLFVSQCHEKGLLDLSDDGLAEKVCLSALARGSFSTVEWMWANGFALKSPAQEAVEKTVFSPVKFDKGTHGDVVLALWERWGKPTQEQAAEWHATVRRFAGPSSRGHGLKIVETLFNPSCSLWNEETALDYLKGLLASANRPGVFAVLEEKVAQKWFSEAVWTQGLATTKQNESPRARLTAKRSHTTAPPLDESTRARLTALWLTHEVSEIQSPSTAVARRRM